MLRIAIQAKGRLNDQSIGLLSEAGIGVAESKRKLISRADGFPMEVLYLRDDDIPQAVAMGVADLGIVGLNEVAEKNFPVERTMDLGFGSCRISLAVDRTADYNGLDYFRGKRVATSYPNILARFFAEKGIDAEIHTIEGSVEIAPAVGMSDAIFDIVSSGGTLISNGLVEVEKVFYSEAVLIANPELDEQKRRETAQLTFRFNSILESRGMKYGQIAAQIGRPTACRAVGMANNRNPIAIVVPCHRVVGSTGALVGYAGGLGVKTHLLNLEKAHED